MSYSLWSADLALARRLEAAEAANAFRLIRGSQRRKPDSGWAAEEILGGCAMFGGVGSPVTHLLGGGMAGPCTEGDFDRLEAFFRERGSPCLIDLCPLAHPSVCEQVFRRGYKVIELNNLLVLPLGDESARPLDSRVRVVQPEEEQQFADLICRGFSLDDSADPVFVEMIGGFAGVVESFVAIEDGQFASGASLGLEGRVALLMGDATRAAWRGRGLQTALIHARLARARARGADLAMVTVVPGTASHRNYERAGFRLVYMRVNVSRNVA